MTSNSKREQILENIKTTLESVSSIKKVTRTLLSWDALTTGAASQLPAVAIKGGLPVPVNPSFSSREHAGRTVLFKSEMSVRIVCYGMENENPDTEISNIADDIWKALYEDPTRGKNSSGAALALSTVLKPDVEADVFEPYYAFSFECVITYVHDFNGI